MKLPGGKGFPSDERWLPWRTEGERQAGALGDPGPSQNAWITAQSTSSTTPDQPMVIRLGPHHTLMIHGPNLNIPGLTVTQPVGHVGDGGSAMNFMNGSNAVPPAYMGHSQCFEEISFRTDVQPTSSSNPTWNTSSADEGTTQQILTQPPADQGIQTSAPTSSFDVEVSAPFEAWNMHNMSKCPLGIGIDGTAAASLAPL
jgi:hypothetical protein